MHLNQMGFIIKRREIQEAEGPHTGAGATHCYEPHFSRARKFPLRAEQFSGHGCVGTWSLKSTLFRFLSFFLSSEKIRPYLFSCARLFSWEFIVTGFIQNR